MIENKLELLKQWIQNSDNIVFFGGAGVSTESGIPDFRSSKGIYNMKYYLSPETILSHSFFISRTKEFYEFYRTRMIYQEAKPNITHRKLYELEKSGRLRGIITQNIDGLHQLAGSVNTLELHGSIHRNYCMDCNALYGLDFILHSCGVPTCLCGGIIKPDVVLYEEELRHTTILEAVKLIREAEVLIIGGTSLNVYPAAGLVNSYPGDQLALINKENTPLDQKCNLLINMNLGEAFSLL